MSVKCLGEVSYPHEIRVITGIPRPDYGDNQAKHESKQEPYYPQHLELGSKRYSNDQIIKSKNLYEKYIKDSKKEPQLIYEISNKIAKRSKNGRLYLYQDKIYECDQNYYSKQQVKLLIIDFLEKEKEKFAKLKRKYKI